jgi:hypothetical protein
MSKHVAKTYLSRKEHGSTLLAIPKLLALKTGIESSPVVIEETPDGLLIKRLEL